MTAWALKTVRSEKEGADPASVAFDAGVKTGKEEGVDTVLVDARAPQNKAA